MCFISLEEVLSGEERTFYSFKIYDEDEAETDVEQTEFDKFNEAFESYQQDSPKENEKIKEEHQIIIGTIDKLVDYKTPALCSTFFRAERRASALPPPLNKNKVSNILVAPNSKLRLYCYILNDHIIILCGGGIKSEQQAENCPNVQAHFFLANRIAEFFDAEKKNLGIHQQTKQFPNEYLGYNQGFTI